MYYDIPGREAPATVTLHRNGRVVLFPLPYPAAGPDADLLAAYPLVRPVPAAAEPTTEEAPAPEPQEAATEAAEPTTRKPSRKEV